MSDERVERELRAALLEEDPGELRDDLRRRVAAVPDEVVRRRGLAGSSPSSSLRAVAAALAALAVIGGTIMGVVNLRSTTVGPSPHASPVGSPTSSASPSATPRPSALAVVPPATPKVDAAGLLDSQHGWVVVGHRILATADGGSTWRDETPPGGFGGDSGPNGVAFLDDRHGWVAINETFSSPSDPSYGRIDIWSTTDAGQHWTKARLPKAVMNPYGEVLPQVQFDFLDASHGFAFLSGNIAKGRNDSDLFWTADGGLTWSADRPTGSGGVGLEGTVRFANVNDGVIVNALHGDGIVVTHDGGETWMDATVATSPGSPSAQLFFGQPVFSDARSGIVPVAFQTDSGSAIHVYGTSDAGSSWTSVATVPDGFSTISIVDQRRWVAFDGSEVLRTTDGGATWIRASSVTPTSYSSGPDFVDDFTGWWLEGTAGGSALLATTDGGVTWHPLSPEVTTARECTLSDVALSVTATGAAGGSTYAVIRATLTGRDPCLMPTAPAVEIADATGSEVVSSPGGDTETVLLRSTVDLRLGWSSWCGPTPSAPMTVAITLASGIVSTALPAGFEASCQGVPTGLFIEPVIPTGSPTPSACHARDLKAKAGRQGETGVVHGDVLLTNVGPTACILAGAPVNVELVRADGSALRTELVAPVPTIAQMVVLQPGATDAGWLIVYWANWCGSPPGPLEIRITLAGGAGAFSAPFQGPLVARCDAPGGPSTLQTEDFLPN